MFVCIPEVFGKQDCIVFFDELDASAPHRSRSVHSVILCFDAAAIVLRMP
jgi:hypothetical protein